MNNFHQITKEQFDKAIEQLSSPISPLVANKESPISRKDLARLLEMLVKTYWFMKKKERAENIVNTTQLPSRPVERSDSVSQQNAHAHGNLKRR